MYPQSTIDELRLGKVKRFFSVSSAIDKHTTHSCRVTKLGLVGDEQADRKFHGGVDRAILQYDSQHYKQLSDTFPNSSHLFVEGGFGENLVVAGMNEKNMCVGDKVKVGTVLLEVTQPRQPCFKLNHRFEESTAARFSQNNCITGWLYRVLEEGVIQQGDIIKVTERAYPQWTIAKVQHFLYNETDNREATRQLSTLPPLANDIKNVFKHRLDNNDVEDWSKRLTGDNARLEMRIVDIVTEFKDIKRFYFSRTDLGPLPEFSAGSHITLQLPNGLSRAYSLCNSLDNDTYQIAVSHAIDGRGGSKYLHTAAKVGDTLSISYPANFFKMARAPHHVFIAAGIGITPFIVMIEEALLHNETFELHYCVKNISNYPFKEQLTGYLNSTNIYDSTAPLNISELLHTHAKGTHVYTCGNPRFVNLVRENATHWNDNNVHFENFSAEETENTPFVVTIEESGQEIEVGPNVTMLEAIRNEGILIESSCENGLCGRCKVAYNGDVDHRDSVLTKSEKIKYLTPCVSRAKNDELSISVT